MNYRVLLSRHRTAIMGLQALLIVFFHAPWEGAPRVMTLLGKPGSFGVDVFVFLAGFGLARAIEREPRFDAYMARRARRVLPSYYCAVLLLFAVKLFVDSGSPWQTAGWLARQLLPIGVMLNHEPYFWYVSATLGYYAVAPLIYGCLRRAAFPRLTTMALLLLLGIAVPWISRMDGVVRAVARLPVLAVGLAVGVAMVRTPNDTPPRALSLDMLFFVGMAMAGVAGIALDGGPMAGLLGAEMVRRLCRGLIAPLLAVLAAGAFELAQRFELRWFGGFFNHLGRFSLDVYLGHLVVLPLLEDFHHPLRLAGMLAGGYVAARAIAWTGARMLGLWDWVSRRLRRGDGDSREAAKARDAR